MPIVKPDLDQAIYTPSEFADIGLKDIQSIEANAPRSVGLNIPGIRDYFAPLPPGRIGVCIAQTSNYKTGFLDFVVASTAEQLNYQKRNDECIIHISTEDLIEEQAVSAYARIAKVDSGKIARGMVDDWEGLFQAAIKVMGIPVYRIGESLSRPLKPDEAPMLYLSNINRIIERMMALYHLRPALVVLDYLQALPIDPEIAHGIQLKDQRRLQVRDDIYRIRRGAAAFNCPWWIGVQAKQKLDGAPSPKLYIPGVYDGEESSAIGQRCDRAICQWMPKTMFPVGTVIEYKDLTYKVTDDLMFMRVAKQRRNFAAGRMWKLHINFIENTFVPELARDDLGGSMEEGDSEEEMNDSSDNEEMY